MERQPTPCQQQQGQLVVGAVVGGLGQMVGIPFGVGFMVGSMAFSLIDQPKVYGPRLNDTKIRGADYGEFVTILYGTCRIGGWGEGQGSTVNGPNEFTEHEESSGGKGGPEQINFSYNLSFFNGICEGPIIGVQRRWANGRLVTDAFSSSDETWPFTLYLGTTTQLPDPTMELVYGVGEVCPMRGRAYESINEIAALDYSNARPNVEYEAYTAAGSIPWRVSTFAFNPDLATKVGVIFNAGKVIIYGYEGTIPDHYFEHTYDIHGVEDTALALDVALSPPSGTALIEVRNLNAASSNSGWYQRESFIVPFSGLNPQGIGGAAVYSNDFIYSFCSTGGGNWGLARWIATDATISTASALEDAVLSLGAGDPDRSAYVLGTSNEAGVVYYAQTNDQLIHEVAADLSAVIRSWDYSAENLASPMINGGTFVVYRNAQGQLILCCDRGIVGLKNAHAFYLNDALTLTSIGFTAKPTGPSIIELGQTGLALVNDGIISLIPPPALVTLGSIVANQLERCGLTSAQYDVSDLTQLVRGAVQSAQMTGFNFIDTLRRGYFFDVTEYDGKIVARNRGHGATETIPDGDLCAHVPGSESPEPLEVMRVPEQELPRTIYINFYNYDNEYQTGSQYWRRTVTLSQSDVTLDLPIVLTAGEAQSIAQWHMHFAWLERDRFTFYVSEKWVKLRPTNVVVVRGVNIRITKVDEMPTGVIKCEGVRAFAGAFTGTHITDPINGDIPGDGGGGQPPQEPPSAKADTGLILIDGPWISEAETPNSFRAAMYKDGSGAWSGASLQKSVDSGTSYFSVGSLSAPSIVGTVATALGDFLGGVTVDESHVIRVRLTNSASTLTSTTEAGLLNGLNLIAIGTTAGWEFLQYRTATLVSPGVYDLTGLLRGRFGTEWMMPLHVASEVFVLIETTILIPSPFAEIGVSRKYKAVTFGTAIADAVAVDFANNAVALKPLAPVLLGGGRNAGGDLILNWTPRRRGSGGWPNGVDLPPTETPEAYLLQIATDGTFATVVRQPGSATATYTYTAAMQTTDFGSPQATINWRVAQAGSAAYGYYAKAAS